MKIIKIILILFIALSTNSFAVMYQKTQGNTQSLPTNNNSGSGDVGSGSGSGGSGSGGSGGSGSGGSGSGGSGGSEWLVPDTLFFTNIQDLPMRASQGDSLELIANVPEGFGIRNGIIFFNEGETIGDVLDYLRQEIFTNNTDDYWVLTAIGGTGLMLQYQALRPRVISFSGQNCSTPPDIKLILNGVWQDGLYQNEFPLYLVNCYF